MNHNKNNGVFFVVIAAILWSFGGVCAKFIRLNPLAISALRGLLAALTIGFCRKRWIVRPNKITLLSSLCIMGTSSLYMVANKMTTAANAIVLQYTSPLFVIIMSLLILKVKPKAIDIAAVAAIMGGVSLFFIEHLGKGELLGNILSILSGVLFAGVFFFNSLPGANPQEAAYLGCLLNIVWLPLSFSQSGFSDFNFSMLAVVLFAGIFQTGLAYMAFSKGIMTTPPVTASIACTIEPILNPVWVFLIMGERPGLLAVCGAAIVIATVTFYNLVNIKLSQGKHKNIKNHVQA